MFDDLLTTGAVLGLVLIAIAPLVGIIFLIIILISYFNKKAQIMFQRYGYIVYEENGVIRDTGSEPLNQNHYEMIESGLMNKGFSVKLMFTDVDYDKVQKVINETRENYEKILKTPVDNKAKVA